MALGASIMEVEFRRLQTVNALLTKQKASIRKILEYAISRRCPQRKEQLSVAKSAPSGSCSAPMQRRGVSYKTTAFSPKQSLQ
jgi:hypothetical protein